MLECNLLRMPIASNERSTERTKESSRSHVDSSLAISSDVLMVKTQNLTFRVFETTTRRRPGQTTPRSENRRNIYTHTRRIYD